MIRAAVIAAVIAACIVDSTVENFGDGPSVTCDQLSEHCGRVLMCPQGSDNELGHIETCLPADQPVWDPEELYGIPCIATPRHEGTCVWGCKDDPWGHACNAYDGCFGCKRSER